MEAKPNFDLCTKSPTKCHKIERKYFVNFCPCSKEDILCSGDSRSKKSRRNEWKQNIGKDTGSSQLNKAALFFLHSLNSIKHYFVFQFDFMWNKQNSWINFENIFWLQFNQSLWLSISYVGILMFYEILSYSYQIRRNSKTKKKLWCFVWTQVY